MRYLTLLLISFLLLGCQKTNIYLYGKYLSEQQKNALIEDFKQANFTIHDNELSFPKEIQNTTILHSILLTNPSSIVAASEILSKHNLPVTNVDSLVIQGHYVTKNGLAIFALPEEISNQTVIENNQTFTSVNCDQDIVLSINSISNFSNLNNKTFTWQTLANDEILQLTPIPDGRNINFEVTETIEQHKIGKVKVIRLIPMVDYPQISNCTFEAGTVITSKSFNLQF